VMEGRGGAHGERDQGDEPEPGVEGPPQQHAGKRTQARKLQPP
jgi:hypothetical protein